MANLQGQVVVITGAARGIGEAMAQAFLAEGARVYLADLDAEDVVETAARLGPNASGHALDVRDAAAVQALAELVLAEQGHVDVLCNNAGIGHGAPGAEITAAMWRQVIELNVLGVAYGVAAFLPAMVARGRGTIVNTASIAGLVGFGMMAPYAASKHAVVGMSEALDVELAPKGVRVLAICPGAVNTRIFTHSPIEVPGVKRETLGKLAAQYGIAPKDVGAAAVRAVKSGRRLTVLPGSARGLALLHRLHRSLPHRLNTWAMGFARR